MEYSYSIFDINSVANNFLIKNKHIIVSKEAPGWWEYLKRVEIDQKLCPSTLGSWIIETDRTTV